MVVTSNEEEMKADEFMTACPARLWEDRDQ